MTTFQIIGLLGFLTYLGSFAALQAKILNGNGSIYALLNVIAASLVLLSLTEAFNLASALIQISWIAIGLAGLSWRAHRAYQERARDLPPPRLQPLR